MHVSQLPPGAKRDLAELLDTSPRDDQLSDAELSKALKTRRPRPLTAAMKAAFGTDAPKSVDALRRGIFGDTTPPPGGAVDLGASSSGRGNVYLQANGAFSLGGSIPLRPQDGASALYEAALIAGDGKEIFKTMNDASKAKVLDWINKSIDAAKNEPVTRYGVPSQTARDLKEGSATLLLSLALSSPSSPIREKAVDAYIALAKNESIQDFQVWMIMVLDALADKLSLTTAQKSQLSTLRELACPTALPIDEWLATGQNTIGIRHYMHEQFWSEEPYTRRGFTKQVNPDESITFSKMVNNGSRSFEIKATVSKVLDYDTDRFMLREMNNPKFPIIIYNGHSNLGGNIAAALRNASPEAGTKLVAWLMCRGKQNVAEFTNRFAKTHLITTGEPQHIYGMTSTIGAIIDAVSTKKDYPWMEKQVRAAGDDGKLLFPHNPELYDYRDLDDDGQLDRTPLGVDIVFNDYRRSAEASSTDYRPGPSVDPDSVDGGPMVDAIAFSNTLFTYHAEHNADSPIKGAYGDHVLAGGFYKSSGNEFMKVEEQQKDGETYYKVQVNSRYAGLSELAMGARMAYEVGHYLTEKSKGRVEQRDDLRCMLFAGEWIAYMMGGGGLANQLIKGLGQVHGWSPKVTADTLLQAINSDTHEYSSSGAVDALQRLIA